MKSLISAVLAAFLSFGLVGSPGAVTFTREQVRDYPCISKASLPALISVAQPGDVPPQYRQWAGLWVGSWYQRGTNICHILVVHSISSTGYTTVTYGSGLPFYQFRRMEGQFEMANGRQTLVLTSNYLISYALDDNGSKPLLVGKHGNTMGTFVGVAGFSD